MKKILQLVFLVGIFISSLPAAEEPKVITIGSGEALPKQLYSFNTNFLMPTALHGLSYGNDKIQSQINPLNPAGLRFPGGTIANNYLWSLDSFALAPGDKTGWAAKQLKLFRDIGRKYDFPGYAKYCQSREISPIYVLNVYQEKPEDIPALFEHFDQLGIEIGAIEMGNEPYWDPRSLMNVWKYSEYCRPLAKAIRKHRPKVKIGACFGPLQKGSSYAEKWNAPLAKQKWYDAIVYHEYYGGQGFALEKGVDLPLKALLKPEAFVDEPVEAFAKLLPDKPIWFTEWNIGQKGLQQWKNTGGELLFIAATTSRILEHRAHFEWSCFHQISERKFGAFYHERGVGMHTLPCYELFRMFGSAWSGADQFYPLDNTGDDIIGFATRNRWSEVMRKDLTPIQKDIRLILINRGEDPIDITLPEQLPERVQGRTIKAEPRQQLPKSKALAQTLPVNGRSVSLPPHSISIVGLPAVVEAVDLK